MGKRTGQLAGLAALGALGYMLSKDKKGGPAPVESRARSSDTPVSVSAERSPPTSRMSSDTPVSVSAGPSTPTPRMVDNGDDRDIGGGFHPAGFRRNMETGEMYDPGTVPNRVATSGAPASAASRPTSAPARVAAPAAPRADSSTPGVSDVYPDESRRGRMTSGVSDVYPDESRRGRMTSAPETAMTKRQPNTNTYTRAMGAQAGEAEAYRAAQAAKAAQAAQAARAARPDNRPDLSTPEGRKRAEQQQALERVYPEQAFIAPGAKAVAAFARGLANRTPRLAEMTQEALAAPVRRLPAPTYLLKKKGGTVKKMASGGSTSGASKRADGIAQRGKTRGKLY